MTVTSTEMATAMQGLQQALEAPRRPGVPLGNWRWGVRQRMGAVRDALVAETGLDTEGWLGRLSRLGPRVLENPDVDEVRSDLHRLLVDVSHHVQRLHDLAYDEVELELGGSE
jgi:hypothetical protein